MGIQKRLVGSYFAVILITVCILEIFLIASVNYYYYHNVERILVNQAEISASFFHQYFAEEELEKQSERLLNGFSQNTAAQVQIISSSGQLLQDSAGAQDGKNMLDYPDVQEACSGTVGIWKGREPSVHDTVLAVSYPLQAKDMTVGAVRFVTSLTDTMATIRYITVIFISVGLIVVAIVAVLGIFLSRTITGSITELKLAAEQMAEGDFTARAKKRYRDELGTLADTFNTMAAKIRRNEQLKNDFISSVSHEIRTPLTSIKGWVVTLKTEPKDGTAMLADGLEIIESETDRLTVLVDELLDLSKLDNGRIVLSRTPLHLADLLRHIGKQLAPRAARQSISLEVQADDTLPVIHADENRLKQVLINLLDNALKFTGPNGIIKVYTQSSQEQVVITVEDTGAGIAEEDIEHVLQKFYKGNNSAAGSGLGLSICYEIVKLHQGQLKIDSQSGQGTKVYIYLPRN
ncbi:HAMP domain-containing histidine kinase [Paenibacillus sp. MER TA 81-3]|uniref:sensor histidine kinase n=1 Tax=Paenibacillus sp. MER TA 81-3 TaxID=2939573 RepID=UPI0020407341|nr:HAMP domain-containing sensor histidine kinase [Paenibacillus sp. MER TA 81-3]MCM3340532.1 HAMP domain-containing histidine kinase [Paenibacillus sp. MER TA 81-3]